MKKLEKTVFVDFWVLFDILEFYLRALDQWGPTYLGFDLN